MLIKPHLECEYLAGVGIYDEPLTGLVSNISTANNMYRLILHPLPSNESPIKSNFAARFSDNSSMTLLMVAFVIRLGSVFKVCLDSCSSGCSPSNPGLIFTRSTLSLSRILVDGFWYRAFNIWDSIRALISLINWVMFLVSNPSSSRFRWESLKVNSIRKSRENGFLSSMWMVVVVSIYQSLVARDGVHF